MIVVNFFAEPSAGKSVASAYTFAELKKKNYNAEYLQEFAKEKLYEKNDSVFQCEPYIFSKQLYRLSNLNDNIDVAITDSPILLPCFYEKDLEAKELLEKMSLYYFNKFNNINYFIIRNHNYEKKGRFQNEDESRTIKNDILDVLHLYKIPFKYILSTDINENFIDDLILKIKKINEITKNNKSLKIGGVSCEF